MLEVKVKAESRGATDFFYLYPPRAYSIVQDQTNLQVDELVTLIYANLFDFFYQTKEGHWVGRDRTRVGRGSLFKLVLPCPDALTDLRN